MIEDYEDEEFFEQNEEEIRIIANYESFVRISCVYNGQFAFVWTEDNLMGVVDYDGNVIVTPEYQKIEYPSSFCTDRPLWFRTGHGR